MRSCWQVPLAAPVSAGWLAVQTGERLAAASVGMWGTARSGAVGACPEREWATRWPVRAAEGH